LEASVGRIPDEEVERLKQEVPIEQLVTAHGVKLVRRGADLVALCPFHDDHAPSLVVSPTRNLFHCLGACRAGGSVIDWVMKAERVPFREAVERLQAMRLSPRAKSEAKIARSPIETGTEGGPLLDQAAAYYHETLKATPRALAYVESRGLSSQEMVTHFMLGFADQSLQKKIPTVDSKAGVEMREAMKAIGLMRQDGREHFMGTLVIPIFDEPGSHVVSMYGRRISPPLSKTTPVHWYLPGPHQGVFNTAAFSASEDIILCEALIDALTFWCAGFRNVSSSYGVEGFTTEILAAMRRHHTRRVFIAYDRDAAGDRAAEALAKKLLAEEIECFRVEFPKGMDANQYALTMKPAGKSLALVLKKARWMGPGDAPAHPYERLDLHLEALPLSPSPPPSPRPSAADSVTEEITRAVKAFVQANDGPPSFVSEVMVLEAATTMSAATPVSIPGPPPSSSPPAPSSPLAIAHSPEPIAEPISPFAASSTPATFAPQLDIPVELRGNDEVVVRFGERRYRVRGLFKNLAYDLMKVNLLVGHGEHYFVDTLDLYSARHRALYLKQATLDVGISEDVLKKDLGHLLMKLEELQDQHIQKTLQPREPEVKLSPAEEEEALALLKDPKLLDRILKDFERAGVVGEETNKLMGYLASISRKLEEPLAVIIQSSSAAGKTSLMEALLDFVPKEDRTKYSAMTGQSLFYMGETNLRHKILAIVEEQGAERASYALKLLQSEKELTIAATGKDPTTGRLITHEYKVEGPVMIVLTTTAAEIDDELLNRSIVLTVNEERAQTQAIHRLQRTRETLSGLLTRQERTRILKLHQNAQRLLRPLYVANPYAERLTFLDSRTRMRRDHMKYLVLIRSIALLHQHQREKKTIEHAGDVIEYIEVTLDDVATANRLAHSVLGRSLDELAPQTRRLLQLLDAMATKACAAQAVVRKDYRFTRKDVREATGWGNTQLKVHLSRLEDFEYIAVRGGRGQRFEYELLYDGQGQDGAPFLFGLIDVAELGGVDRAAHTLESPQNRSALLEDRSGSNGERSGGGRPAVGWKSGGGRIDEIEKKASAVLPLAAEERAKSKNAHPGNGHDAGADGVGIRSVARRAP
jgi:DNA primase catalytic core